MTFPDMFHVFSKSTVFFSGQEQMQKMRGKVRGTSTETDNTDGFNYYLSNKYLKMLCQHFSLSKVYLCIQVNGFY